MDIAEFQQRINDTINEIEANREAEALRIVGDALALIKRRVINSGKKADGGTFGGYSEAVVPFWFYKNKESRRGQNAVDDLYKQFGYWASYKDWREVNNLPTEFKNFSFTGRMWQSVLAEISLRSESRVVVTIQATDQEAIQKLQYVSEQSGNILEPNSQEADFVFKANDLRWQKVLNKNFP